MLEDGKQQVQVVGLSERPVDSVDQVGVAYLSCLN